MSFKQFSWYNMQGGLLLEGDALEEALSQKQAYKPHATQSQSMGWVSPLGEGQPLAVQYQSLIWLAVRIDRKLLPQGVVTEELKEQLKNKEQEQGYPVTGKQRRVLKEEITLDLLPKAFVQSKQVNIVIDQENKIFMVDQNSAQVKDAIVELLRQTVGNCPLTHHLDYKSQTSQILTKWMVSAPGEIQVESECTLVQPNNVNTKARVIGVDQEMIVSYLDQGMMISQLMLEYRGQVKFQLNDQLEVSRVKYLDIEDVEKLDDPIEQAMADFALWVPYFIQLIQQLKEWFPMGVEVEEPVDVS